MSTDPPLTKRSVIDLRTRRSALCPRCRRIHCNCPIIDHMRRLGWYVYRDEMRHLWKIAEPDGAVYTVGYAESVYAWNFAVQRFIESLPDR